MKTSTTHHPLTVTVSVPPQDSAQARAKLKTRIAEARASFETSPERTT